MEKTLKSHCEKCSGCGGNLIFSPKTQGLICEQCGKIEDFEKSNAFEKHPLAEANKTKKDYKEWVDDNKVIQCSNCGAKIVLSKLEYAATCPYCGSSQVSLSEELPGISPDAIIPFRFDEETAGQKFIENVKKKFFVPRAFKKKIPENKIKGIYIPSFTFDSATASSYSGVLARYETYSDGKTTHTRTVTFRISGTKNLIHKDVMVEASSHITQKQLEQILPFMTENNYKFDENFIRGYVVEHYDTDSLVCHDEAKKIIDNNIRKIILSKYSYDRVDRLDINTQYFDEKFLYKISPIYTFEYKYKDKNYITLMNGQTGKLGKGLPISKLKVAAIIISVLLIIAIVAILIALFGEPEVY